MKPHDTSDEAWALLMRLLREAGPARRLSMTLQMCDGVRAISRAGIRDRHPEWSEEQRRRQEARIVLGELSEQLR